LSALPNTINLEQRLRSRRKLASRTVPASAVILYECPISRSCEVSSVVIASVTTSTATVRVHHVASGEGSTSTANALLYDVSVAPGTTTVLEVALYMNSGDRLVVQSGTASALCATAYGSEA